MHKNDLVSMVASESLEKIGNVIFVAGIATQTVLPNIAFLADLVNSGYAEKLYEHSTHPYALAGTVIAGSLYYFSKKFG
jgi:hypothetical protein